MAPLAHRLRAWAEKDGRGYPDWAVRYEPIARRLQREAPKFVVEIGANQNGLARFWSGRVIAVDRERAQLEQARSSQGIPVVQADITRLPFADGVLPAWAAVEVLEHVPPSARDDALRELARVLATDGVGVLTFPSGQGALEAEEEIRAAYANLTGEQLRWLAEHEAEGLPDAVAVAETLRASGRGVTIERNANLAVWRWMWRVLLCNWPGRGNALAQVALRILTPVISRIHWGPCYRAVVWIGPKR